MLIFFLYQKCLQSFLYAKKNSPIFFLCEKKFSKCFSVRKQIFQHFFYSKTNFPTVFLCEKNVSNNFSMRKKLINFFSMGIISPKSFQKFRIFSYAKNVSNVLYTKKFPKIGRLPKTSANFLVFKKVSNFFPT